MQSSQDTAEIFAALAIAQGSVDNATKNAQNPHLKNRYADLASVLDVARAPLAANALAVITLPSDEAADGGVAFETRIAHKSGQWLATRFVMPLAKRDAQGLGSAITYARRYALSAWLGIAQEDDDAEAAVRPGKSVAQSVSVAESEPRLATANQYRQPPRKPVDVPPRKSDAIESINQAKTLDELAIVSQRIATTLSESSPDYALARKRYSERKAELSKGAA